MQVIKNISIISAVLASLAVAAPVGPPSGQVVQIDQSGKLFVPANGAPAPSQAPAPAPAQATAVVTVTAGQPAPAATTAAATHAAHSGKKENAAQPQPTAATSVANAPAPSQAHSSSAAAPTASQSSSSSSTAASGGSGLTIINKCSKTVSAAKFANLAQNNNGAPQDIQPGGSAHFPIDGASQVVKVYWQGTDIWSGDNTNAEVEWNVGNGMAFYDLSLLKGNPFLQYGQSLQGPCASTITNSKTLSCKANDASCAGTYFPGYTQDAGISCPALGQGQGLTYTLCSA